MVQKAHEQNGDDVRANDTDRPITTSASSDESTNVTTRDSTTLAGI